jgi:hypothetical protein
MSHLCWALQFTQHIGSVLFKEAAVFWAEDSEVRIQGCQETAGTNLRKEEAKISHASLPQVLADSEPQTGCDYWGQCGGQGDHEAANAKGDFSIFCH